MDFISFDAHKDDSGRRIDKILRRLLPEQNLSGIFKLIRKGLVKVNDKKIQNNFTVNEGDKIKIASFIFEKSSDVNNEFDSKNTKELISQRDFSILKPVFQNEDIFIINKPYGFSVHGKNDSLDNIVKDFYRQREKLSLSFLPGPLHRLDERTTGLLCFSWSLKGAKWFSENIKNHSIKKEYLAIVEGKITENEKWIDLIDSKNKNNENKAFKTVKIQTKKENPSETLDIDSYKEAVTEVFPLSYGKYGKTDFTFVKFLIHTGRTHQIRSQSSFHGHPLLGDNAYGGRTLENERQLFLHACKLTFPQNPIGLPETLKCLPDENFINFLKSCNCETDNLSL